MIPELHDIGKLLGLEKHWLEGFGKPDWCITVFQQYHS